MKYNARILLTILIGASIFMGGYEGFLFFKEMELSQNLRVVWGLIFLMMLALWVIEDSKAYKNIYKPFDYGFLVFVFYIPYLPYYLVKTRGWLLGGMFLLGLVLLFNIGYVLRWLIYMAR